MTEIGEKGRLGPGESFRRAVETVATLHARGSKRRYRIEARLVEPGWWAYGHKALPKVKQPPPEPRRRQAPMSREEVAERAAKLPRCAQRAREDHGGDSKVAWPTQAMAHRAADALGCSAYECQLPAPAIGRHWHVTTRKKRKRRR